ncbi:MAG: glycosyltransferase family 1 protein [Bacteroidetes bacterium]|nr:glycosyltransferase family 1 protein [Bacteroidota bacterium]
MPELHLHIISFTIPFPPNYGGVIDVYYKIRALHAAGVRIHLHCFAYDREPSAELEKYCHKVHYYPRKTGLWSALAWKPYIVFSRRSDKLLETLLKDDHPILFEGLHTCYYLSHPKLKERVRIYRESNIEHQYYFHLSKAETNLPRKAYFFLSSLKLLAFEGILSHATMMLTVSKEDTDYLSRKFPDVPVEYLPSFHKDDDVNILAGTGDYALYQGNLSVAENVQAAEYLMKEVLPGTNVRMIVSGLNPSPELVRLAGRYPDVTLIPNPPEETMNELIRSAQVNILVTFQPTGLKLKLLNALFNGRFCLVNPQMVTGTELGELCETGTTAAELKTKLIRLMHGSFDEEAIRARREQLLKWHSNNKNCKRLTDLVSLQVWR